ncbi:MULTISPECIES: DHA2 family efflux MFS transporter permease subunit [Bacillus]|uniref:DHA2 family efflux MFS transporter permease subunit n=1 Tax=Bacillus TaxID=1386 RepID=UPI00030E0FC2|nr:MULTISPECIES: DHA2 family efflux MFS transporter permease subunit [Bacillus]
MENKLIGKQVKPDYGILAILLIGAFVALLSNTLLNIALPSIMKEFDITASTVQWLTNGYMLVNGIMIPSTAFLIQRYSVRKLFLTAMTLFTIGTITAGFSPVFALLLIGRMIQASGAAIMMPLLMNVLLTSFPIEKRGGAMGIMGLVMIFAPAIGPTLSGWIIEHYSWPMLFHIISPIALLVLIFAFFKLNDKKEKVVIKLDVLSIILSSIGFGGVLYGCSTAGNKGWDDPQVYITLIVGVIALIVFILRQLKLEQPMLDFRIYKYPMFALGSAISITLNMALFSAMLLMPIYLQNLRGISPLDSGLLMLPGAIVMGIMSPITGKLFDKFGAKILALVGLSITIITTYYFSKLTFTTTYTTLIILYTIRMFGMSMVMMPIMTNGLNQLPLKSTPHGTAMNSTLSQVSGAIGGALLVTVMANRTTTHAKELAEAAMSKLTGTPSEAAMAEMKQQIMAQATINGINDSFFVSMWITVFALILALFIRRVKLNASVQEDNESTKEAAANKEE